MGCLQVGASKRSKVLVAAMVVGDICHGHRQHRGSLPNETNALGFVFHKKALKLFFSNCLISFCAEG